MSAAAKIWYARRYSGPVAAGEPDEARGPYPENEQRNHGKMPPSSKTLTMAAQYSAGAGGSFHEVRVAFGVTNIGFQRLKAARCANDKPVAMHCHVRHG